MSTKLLTLRNLCVTFTGGPTPVYAVRNIDLEVSEGEILGLVGESGSGKSALGAALMNLHDSATTTLTTSLWRLGYAELSPQNPEWRHIRGRRVAMVFQDPMTALNPYLRIGSQLAEVLCAHTGLSRKERTLRCLQALREVGLPGPEQLLRAYPHMLSGGMRQRVVIAMALLGQPELLIADEPTTALDVTVQAQILALLKGLCQARGMAMVFITHDLAVLAGIADRISVMYAGELVETGPAQKLYDAPSHPYSRALWRAMPDLTEAISRAPEPIPGVPPHLAAPPEGCAFAPRCSRVQPDCLSINPQDRAGHPAALLRCHNPLPEQQGAAS